MSDSQFLQKTRAFIRESLDRWHVPGTAVVVIKDGQPLICEGYGLRDVEQNLSMSAETVMPIASCTKAFTAMAVGLLVDEGKLDWDKPVRTWLPTFQLYDHLAAERITVRDLLSHRTGLPRYDFVWIGSKFNRRQIFDRLRFLEPICDFRTAFYYNNLMYMTAGYLVEEAAGCRWEQFVQERILAPSGMQNTNLSPKVTSQLPNRSEPYLYRDCTLRKLSYYTYEGDEDPLAPAGAVCSCVADLSQWLSLQTNAGASGERQLISKRQFDQMHRPHVFIDDPQARSLLGTDFDSYGLGWHICSYKGQVMCDHTGGIDGFVSMVSFLPKRKIGIAVLSNGDPAQNYIPRVITHTLYDWLLGLEPTDWNAKYLAFVEDRDAAAKKYQAASESARHSAPLSHPIDAYLGDYEHLGYGVYSVIQEGEDLKLVANGKLVLPLTHYHFDTFNAHFEYVNVYLKVLFFQDARGNIAGFQVQLEPMMKEQVFTRVSSRQ